MLKTRSNGRDTLRWRWSKGEATDKSDFGNPKADTSYQLCLYDNAQTLVTGRVQRQGDGRFQVAFRLWDISAGQYLIGQQFLTQPENWRRIAHIISDLIYQRLTGEKGYFDNRIVFIDETGPKDKRNKRLAIMDQDGANVRYLTRGDELVLTPRFSPTNQDVTYMSYGRGDQPPRVMLMNIESGQREVVGDFPNMAFSPRFSPSGQGVIMSLQEQGASNIFTMDLRTKRLARLTSTQAINTAPSYSPDGQQIVFESDRGGSQQLYVMSADGSNQRRISPPDGGRVRTPVWSPRGVHETGQRIVLHRRHAHRWLGRAHSHRRLP